MTTIQSSYKKDISRPNTAPRVRISPLIIGVYAVLLAIIFLPVTISMINAGNDFPMHIHWAWYWDKTGMVTAPLPHFLYQVVAIPTSSLKSKTPVMAILRGVDKSPCLSCL